MPAHGRMSIKPSGNGRWPTNSKKCRSWQGRTERLCSHLNRGKDARNLRRMKCICMQHYRHVHITQSAVLSFMDMRFAVIGLTTGVFVIMVRFLMCQHIVHHMLPTTNNTEYCQQKPGTKYHVSQTPFHPANIPFITKCMPELGLDTSKRSWATSLEICSG